MQGPDQKVARASCPCFMGETRLREAASWGKRPMPRYRAGFSILEVLCVLLVLSLFYGFIMTAVTALRKGGETRRARTETLALAQALQTYRRVYGRWPGIVATGTTNDVLVTGESQTNVVADLLDNPRGLDLIDPPAGVVTNRLYLDPWGNPYLIAMDTSGDGHLWISEFGIFITNITAGVMSHGGDGTTNTVPIRSWEIHHAR